MALLLSLFFCLFQPRAPLWADATVIGDDVLNATKLLQETKYSEAFNAFDEIFKSGRESSAHLYNWGLAAYRMDKKGLAVGLWRRALYLDPELISARQALDFIAHELPQDMSYESSGYWYALRTGVLDKVGLNKTLILVWVFFVTSAFLLIRYWGRRQRALKENTPMPHLPILGLVFAGFMVFCLILTTAKIVSLFEIRATVIANPTTMRTGPDVNDNSIFDLVEGLEVSVKDINNQWVLITLPTGLSGWVPTENLFQHTGKTHSW